MITYVSFILAIFFGSLIGHLQAETRSFSFALPLQRARPALLSLPDKKPSALLVVLHGGSRNASLAMGSDSEGEWNVQAALHGWAVLYPSGTSNQKNPDKLLWNDCRLAFGSVGPEQTDTDDVAYLDALIRKVLADLDVKEDRVLLTGHSNGGGMSFRMAMESTLPLRAMAPMLMTLPRDAHRCQDRWQKPLPTAYLLGTADPMVAFQGGKKGRSGAETLAWIREKNRASFAGPPLSLPDRDTQDGAKGQSSTLLRQSFGPSSEEINTVFWIIQGGGHQIPGLSPVQDWIVKWLGPKNRDLNVRAEIAAFFQAQLESVPK